MKLTGDGEFDSWHKDHCSRVWESEQARCSKERDELYEKYPIPDFAEGWIKEKLVAKVRAHELKHPLFYRGAEYLMQVSELSPKAQMWCAYNPITKLMSW